LALVVAVGAVSAVGFFTDRIHRVIEQQAADLFIERAQSQGLQTAHIQTFPSVIVHGDESVLISLKAVSEAYPLRGMLRVSEMAYGPEIETTAIPRP